MNLCVTCYVSQKCINISRQKIQDSLFQAQNTIIHHKHFTSTTTATGTQQFVVYIMVCSTNLRKCSLAFVNSPKIKDNKI